MITLEQITFYRGGNKITKSAYFSSSELIARCYGPTKEYRLTLRNPKHVEQNEWMAYTTHGLQNNPSTLSELSEKGYDSVIWAKETFTGTVYNVFALFAKDAAKEVKS